MPDDILKDIDDVTLEQGVVEAWMQQHLKVVNTDDQLVPFRPNDVQQHIYKVILMQRRAGKPVRIIVLKSRREGVSTGTAAYYYARTHLKPYHSAFVSAHDSEGCKTQWNIVKRYEDNLPKSVKLPIGKSDATEIRYESPHGASYRVQTAGNENMGSGAGYTDLHLSELAKWAHDKSAMTSIMQTVPDKPHTTVVIESTANGVGGLFYEMWNAAVRKQLEQPGYLDGFIPLFFTSLTPEHALTVPHGYIWGMLDENEIEWQEAGATPEQLYWRRVTIENKCAGSVDQFKQEYPLTPDEAFLASGRPAIDRAITKHHRDMVTTPRRGRFRFDSQAKSGVRVEYGDYRDTEMGWNIWEEVTDNMDYCVGCDTSTGISSDPDDKAADPDSHAIYVLKREPLRVIACHSSRVDADQLGREVVKVGRYYNTAWASPELAGGSGVTVLNALLADAYPRIYHREAEGDSVDLSEIHKLGWKTTRSTRNQMIDDWLAACRKDPELGWDFALQVPDANLIDEEESFVWNGEKREHRSGAHDDRLFAAMVALQLHRRCVRTHTFVGVGKRYHDPFSAPCYLNGRDPGVPEERKGGAGVAVESL